MCSDYLFRLLYHQCKDSPAFTDSQSIYVIDSMGSVLGVN